MTKKRIKKVAQINPLIQEKVEFGGFMEQGAPVESKKVKPKKPPLEKYDFGGQFGRPYKKK